MATMKIATTRIDGVTYVSTPDLLAWLQVGLSNIADLEDTPDEVTPKEAVEGIVALIVAKLELLS